jgi:selenocysteine lyase/cysteine desulfurase
MKLWKLLRDGLAEIEGVTMYCADDAPGGGRISVLSFNIDGLEAANTGTMLDVDHDIACRTGLHCTPMVHEHLGTDKIHGAARFGIGPFNNEGQIKKTVQAVAEIAEGQKKRARHGSQRQSSAHMP